MRQQILAILWTCLILIAGSIGSLGVAPSAFAQSGEEQMQPEDFGPWTVVCTRDTIYRYVFCNTFHAQASSDGADDLARFGVTRTLGVERIGLNVLNGFAPDSKIMISVDEENWVFPSSGDVAMLASPSQSKKIIDQLLAGRTVHLEFTPAGQTQQKMDVGLETFPEALRRAREQAR